MAFLGGITAKLNNLLGGFFAKAKSNSQVAKGLAIGSTAYRKAAALRIGTPLLVLACLSMITLPLPPTLLDVLFSFNIALSMVVLLVAIYSKRPWISDPSLPYCYLPPFCVFRSTWPPRVSFC